MAEKRLVVNGAICMCNFAPAPDKLKVLTNTKEYANDAEGAKKSIATTMDIGATFEAGTFGPCSKKPYNAPCQSMITEWSGAYENVKLYNEGYPLLEDSKATCPLGGKDCIRIIFHGQTDEMSQQNMTNTSPEVTQVLNPAIDIFSDLDTESNSISGTDLMVITF